MFFPVSLISAALRPVIFQEMASKGIRSQETTINRILNWLAIITVPVVVFYFYYAEDLVYLFFGNQWSGAGFIGKFLIIPIFTYLFCNWMDRILDVLNQQRLVLLVEIVFSVLSIGGIW